MVLAGNLEQSLAVVDRFWTLMPGTKEEQNRSLHRGQPGCDVRDSCERKNGVGGLDRAGAHSLDAPSGDHRLTWRWVERVFAGRCHLNYRRENILRCFTRSTSARRYGAVRPAHINNPGYNRDRGPVLCLQYGSISTSEHPLLVRLYGFILASCFPEKFSTIFRIRGMQASWTGDATVEVSNPVCGDVPALRRRIENGRIAAGAVLFHGRLHNVNCLRFAVNGTG